MVSKTTVVCWIIGIMGILGFFGAMNMPILFTGQYMILSVMVVVAAMYFNIHYKHVTLVKKIHLDAAQKDE